MDTVVFVFATIVVMLSLYFLERMRKRINIGKYVSNATKSSAFSPTEFHIYDKSSERRCDRLIIVQPFDWYVWAIGGQLYILNPEGSIMCGTGCTPAVKVLKRQFLEVCLKIGYDSLLRGYTEGVAPSKIVPYEIESTTFTILSALNLLVKEYVTLSDTEPTKLEHRIETITDDDANNTIIEEEVHARNRRYVSADTVNRMMSRDNVQHALLLDMYRWHMRKRADNDDNDDDDRRIDRQPDETKSHDDQRIDRNPNETKFDDSIDDEYDYVIDA